MDEFTFKLSHPITDEEWNLITDAELERTNDIEFTTPSGKKVLFQKVKHGRWEPLVRTIGGERYVGDVCSVCGDWQDIGIHNYCPHCGARMDGDPDA